MTTRGIIPACAGSTHYLLQQGYYPWDHPRMRGEHLNTTVIS